MRLTAADSNIYAAEKVDIRCPSGQMSELRQANREWFRPAAGKLKKYFLPWRVNRSGRRRRKDNVGAVRRRRNGSGEGGDQSCLTQIPSWPTPRRPGCWVPWTPDDAEWFAGRLPSCPDCRAAMAEFGQVPLRGAVEPLPGQGAAQRPPRMERPRLHRPQRKFEPGRDLGLGRAYALKATVGKDGLFDLSRALAWLRDNASDVHVEIGIDAVAGDEGFDRVRLRNGVFEPLEEKGTHVEVTPE